MAENLKAWIKAQGWTQREFAKRIDRSEVYVSQITCGAYRMNDKFRERFEMFFGSEAAAQVFGNGCIEAGHESG